MRHFSPISEPLDLRDFTKRAIRQILRSIAQQGDDALLKDCIMTAREHGHLDDEETAFLINVWGVQSA